MRQVVHELGPDALQATQLGDVLQHQPDALGRGAPSADDEGGALALTRRQLAVGRAVLACPFQDVLHAMVDEGLHGVRPTRLPGAGAEEDVGGAIRLLDAPLVGDADDADPDEVEQEGEIPLTESASGNRLPLRGHEGDGRGLEVVAFARPERLADPRERRAARDRQSDRDGQRDAHATHEQEELGTHWPSLRAYKAPAHGGMTPGTMLRAPAGSHPARARARAVDPSHRRPHAVPLHPARGALLRHVRRGRRQCPRRGPHLEEMLRTYDDVEQRAKEIYAMEHHGDELSHEIGKRLNTSFITPFDREDIHGLISGLDDVLDLIEEVADTFSSTTSTRRHPPRSSRPRSSRASAS